jgi:hypothetical protein
MLRKRVGLQPRRQLRLEPGVPHDEVPGEEPYLLRADRGPVLGAGELCQVVGQHAAEGGQEAGARVAGAAAARSMSVEAAAAAPGGRLGRGVTIRPRRMDRRGRP